MDEFGSDVVNLHDTQVNQMDVTNVRLRSTQEDTGMLKPEVVDRIHELSDQGLGSKRIARQLKVSRKTVRRYLAGATVGFQERPAARRLDAKTLRKHFRSELDRGSIEANIKVAQTLFTMATVDKNVAAAIFWMKARAGWREKMALTGENGVPVMIITGVQRHGE